MSLCTVFCPVIAFIWCTFQVYFRFFCFALLDFNKIYYLCISSCLIFLIYWILNAPSLPLAFQAYFRTYGGHLIMNFKILYVHSFLLFLCWISMSLQLTKSVFPNMLTSTSKLFFSFLLFSFIFLYFPFWCFFLYAAIL